MTVGPQETIPKSEYLSLLRRAVAAFLLDPKEVNALWPEPANSNVTRFPARGGLWYVVLRDGKGNRLAVYRVRRGEGSKPGQLKKLVKRFPEGLV